MVQHAPDNYDCPFCRIIQRCQAGIYHPGIVYHTDMATAFIGNRQWPANHGNTLVVPNHHYENIYELPVELAVEVHALARAVAVALKTAFRCDGISLRQHNEPAGNQDVWHYHVHVTPRYTGDQFYANYTTSGKMIAEDELERLASLIRPCMIV